MRTVLLHLFCLSLLALSGCGGAPSKPVTLSARIVSARPHDAASYTQGLQWKDARLYESAGMYGQSNVRIADPATGAVLLRTNLPAHVFGEGLAIHDGKIYTLTWREQTAFILDLETLNIERTATYEGEGWGLTSDGTHLIMSDGTSRLRYIDPATFTLARTLTVTENKKPLINLNELEFVDGQIFANIYLTDRIVRIDPRSGRVTGALDLSDLRTRLPSPNQAEVLNGIAFDTSTGHFFITGKYWPEIFELDVSE